MSGGKVPEITSVASPPRRPDLTYELVKDGDVIGSGGHAIVKRTALPGSDPPDVVAVKEPQAPTGTLDAATIESFFQEANTWAKLAERERTNRHRNTSHIVGIVAIGDRMPWVAMEYMDGGSLADRLDSYPEGLPIEETLWIMECLCEGVKLAHDHGIAHLDLKPANVLFRETPGTTWDVPKIADWGLARTLLDESGSMDAFSVEYAAPEQFDSEQFGSPDIHTDIYQLGAILYEMLTGRPPYTGSQASIMHDVVYGDGPELPSARREAVPTALDEVVLRALKRDKSQRYRGAVELFAEALQGIKSRDTSGKDVQSRDSLSHSDMSSMGEPSERTSSQGEPNIDESGNINQAPSETDNQETHPKGICDNTEEQSKSEGELTSTHDSEERRGERVPPDQSERAVLTSEDSDESGWFVSATDRPRKQQISEALRTKDAGNKEVQLAEAINNEQRPPLSEEVRQISGNESSQQN